MNEPPSNPSGGAPPNVWSGPEALIGTVLDNRYEIVRAMGSGGMGAVFEGKQITLRKKVAIKVLNPQLTHREVFVNRFLQEARAASMIRHRHIVDIIDFGRVPNGIVYFVMEYLEGQDLAALIRAQGRFRWVRCRGILRQIIRALKSAHTKGIIHRDVKPANCFMVDSDEDDHVDFVKVLDFGIAKVTEPDPDAPALTGTKEMLGTARYMAPEQAFGKPADARTDIYALGVVAYEMLTGRPPFLGQSDFAVLHQHTTEPPPSMRGIIGTIPEPVEEIVMKALEKEPEDRYQTMAEFEQAIIAVGSAVPRPTLVPGQVVATPVVATPESTLRHPIPEPVEEAPSEPTIVLDSSGGAKQVIAPTAIFDGGAARPPGGSGDEHTAVLPGVEATDPNRGAAQQRESTTPTGPAMTNPQASAEPVTGSISTSAMTTGGPPVAAIIVGIAIAAAAAAAAVGYAVWPSDDPVVAEGDFGADDEAKTEKPVEGHGIKPLPISASGAGGETGPVIAEPALDEDTKVEDEAVAEPVGDESQPEPKKAEPDPPKKPPPATTRHHPRPPRERKQTDQSVKRKITKRAKRECKGAKGARVSVRFTIKSAGHTSLVEPNPNNTLGRCVKKIVRAATFPAGKLRSGSLTITF